MATVTLQQAHDLINELREEQGGISAKDRAFLEENRPQVLKSLAAIRKKASNATKILVANLYSKDTRFLYELIQNADDNEYSVASTDGSRPYLNFDVYPDKIIVDSNEDGFTERNVRAICSTGESTKTNHDGYIGEKGIGFKAVFKIAKRVHIQSGSFSFAFEYSQEADGDGLGMVTPQHADFNQLPTGVRTRMVLTFRNEVDFEELSSEFKRIPEAFLLFLRRLKTMTIRIHPSNGEIVSSEYSKAQRMRNGLVEVSLTKVVRSNKNALPETKRFYTITRALEDLPRDPARLDKAGKNINRATTVLAFPIDDHDTPVLEQQYTFAFLPLRQVGFKFLIQSDFVTQANREDVVSSPRNKAILRGVSRVFAEAIQQFCNHPSLRYKWMRYLPDESIADEYWKELVQHIRNDLAPLPLLEHWDGKDLYPASRLRRLTADQCDEFRNPLLRDIPEKKAYLSRKYTEDDFHKLKCLGTENLNSTLILDRLERDLQGFPAEHPQSLWQSFASDQDWRNRICNLLLTVFDVPGLSSSQGRLRMLPLIPLHNGVWRRISGRSKCYFPRTQDVSIPLDLGLDLVHPNVPKSGSWAVLSRRLGVESCDPKHVVECIRRRHQEAGLQDLKVDNCVEHLRYLYHFLPEGTDSLDSIIKICNQTGIPAKKDLCLYFPGNRGIYSPGELFKENGTIPGCEVEFLHSKYLDAVGENVRVHDMAWITWLEQVAGVRRAPQLCSPTSPDDLSPEFCYIIQYRPEKLFGTLKCYWQQYDPQLSKEKPLTPKLRRRKIPTNSVPVEKNAIQSVFLPFPELELIAKKLEVLKAFPFVRMPTQLHDEDRTQWGFLQRLGVGMDADYRFYLRALAVFQILNLQLDATSVPDGLSEIYDAIQSMFNKNAESIRQAFKKTELIFVPSPKRVLKGWVLSSDCVWEGPEWLQSKQRLDIECYQKYQSLFKNSLGINDAGPEDILTDLRALKKREPNNVALGDITRIYKWIRDRTSSSRSENEDDPEFIRNAFEKESLIYVPSEKTWVSPSACVWVKSDVNIPNKSSIATTYDTYKRLFTTVLHVAEPSARMYIESLKAEANGNARTLKLKETMALISSMKPNPADIEALASVPIFPVRLDNGEQRLASAFSSTASIDFAIVDMREHMTAFKDKIAYLDFSAKDQLDTRGFIEASGLTHRYTSKCVEEVTDAEKASRDSVATTNLRLKANAFIRCVAHYTSTGHESLESLWRSLRGATAYLSDSIQLSTRITQDGRIIEGSRSQTTFHITLRDGFFHLYLPTKPLERAICLEKTLPQRFCNAIGISDPQGISVVASMFRYDDLAIVNGLLEESAVAEFEGNFEGNFEEPNGEAAQDMPDSDNLASMLNNMSISTSAVEPRPSERLTLLASPTSQTTRARTPITPERTPSRSTSNSALTLGRGMPFQFTFTPDSSRPATRDTTPRRAGETTIASGDTLLPPDPRGPSFSAQNDAYQKLLETVVDVARCRARSEVLDVAEGSCDGVSEVPTLGPDVLKDALGPPGTDRKFRVGAAGELYMFEYLKELGLPSFDLANWPSGIRSYVKQHPDYSNIENSNNRRAFSDIEYNDAQSKVTEFLIRKGHLNPTSWAGKTPKYHFEIKATSNSNRREGFYLSHNQEAHIRNHQLGEDGTESSIYVICRLFNIGEGNRIGLSVYLDPETKRRNGELVFSPYTWKVTPQ